MAEKQPDFGLGGHLAGVEWDSPTCDHISTGVTPMPARTLTVQQRKSIFHALVELQDSHTVSVADSKKEVAKKFHITKEQLELIEREGVSKDWPPLA
jgi:hypothetical protein